MRNWNDAFIQANHYVSSLWSRTHWISYLTKIKEPFAYVVYQNLLKNIGIQRSEYVPSFQKPLTRKHAQSFAFR